MNRQAKSNGLMAANVAIRIGYGFGGLLAPAAMAKLRLAPDVGDHPEARLFVRGFSAHQIGVAALGLASWRWQTPATSGGGSRGGDRRRRRALRRGGGNRPASARSGPGGRSHLLDGRRAQRRGGLALGTKERGRDSNPRPSGYEVGGAG